MDQLSNSELQTDRQDTKRKIDELVAKGTPIIAGTNLAVEGASISQDEVNIMKLLMNAAFPTMTGEDMRSKAHLELAGRFAHKFGDALKATGKSSYTNLNSDFLEVAALGHDIGRSITQRALRHDIAGDMVLTQMGMRSDLIASMPSALAHTKITRRFLQEFQSQNPHASPEELQGALKDLAQKTLDDSSIEQRIVLISDICGKPGDGLKGIRTFEEVITYHHNTRSNYEEASGRRNMYPSDSRIDQYVIDFTEHLYRLHKDWLASEGVDVEQVRHKLLDESEHQQ